MSLNISKILTEKNKTTANRGLKDIKYIVVHYVGALGSAKANCEYYRDNSVSASAHYFVGHDGEYYQSVLDKDIAWHCGASSYKHSACRNANSIGIEMCVKKTSTKTMNAEDKDWYFQDATLNATTALVAELMEKYNIPIENVIRHYDVTGKLCPAPFVHSPTKWTSFLKGLTNKSESNLEMTQSEFNKMAEVYLQQRKEKPVSSWAKKTWEEATAKKIFDGTMPQSYITREQVSAVLLDRLNLG